MKNDSNHFPCQNIHVLSYKRKCYLLNIIRETRRSMLNYGVRLSVIYMKLIVPPMCKKNYERRSTYSRTGFASTTASVVNGFETKMIYHNLYVNHSV